MNKEDPALGGRQTAPGAVKALAPAGLPPRAPGRPRAWREARRGAGGERATALPSPGWSRFRGSSRPPLPHTGRSSRQCANSEINLQPRLSIVAVGKASSGAGQLESYSGVLLFLRLKHSSPTPTLLTLHSLPRHHRPGPTVLLLGPPNFLFTWAGSSLSPV